MDTVTHQLDRLEQRIDRLKREYDLFLAGRLRIAPAALRDELQREVLRLTRAPFSSTAARFRMKTLAHRFQAVEQQMKNRSEQQSAKSRTGSNEDQSADATVILDRAALENPAMIAAHLRRLHRALTQVPGAGTPPPLEVLEKRLVQAARRQLAEPGVLGVRFSVVSAEGRARIRGEVVQAPETPEG